MYECVCVYICVYEDVCVWECEFVKRWYITLTMKFFKNEEYLPKAFLAYKKHSTNEQILKIIFLSFSKLFFYLYIFKAHLTLLNLGANFFKVCKIQIIMRKTTELWWLVVWFSMWIPFYTATIYMHTFTHMHLCSIIDFMDIFWKSVTSNKAKALKPKSTVLR